MSILDVSSPFDPVTERMIIKNMLGIDKNIFEERWKLFKSGVEDELSRGDNLIHISTILKAINIIEKDIK